MVVVPRITLFVVFGKVSKPNSLSITAKTYKIGCIRRKCYYCICYAYGDLASDLGTFVLISLYIFVTYAKGSVSMVFVLADVGVW